MGNRLYQVFRAQEYNYIGKAKKAVAGLVGAYKGRLRIMDRFSITVYSTRTIIYIIIM